MTKKLRTGILALGFALVACAQSKPAPLDLSTLKLPPGFRIELYAGDVAGARSLALGANGTVFVGSRDQGTVRALIDADHDGRAERVAVIASGLKVPNGVAFRESDLYVAAVDRILRYRAIESHLDAPPQPELVTDKLPSETSHGWRFIAFGPDGRLYVAIGAPCNACDKGDAYAKLISMKADGSDLQDVAHGIRNTVGFDWQPGTNTLWFTDNGRDRMGEDMPADELNRVSRIGEHFGFPYCHQGDTLDPDLGEGKSCDDYTPPVLKLGAHVAAIGMRFYTGTMFPAEYRNAILIAEHGSWDRKKNSGYRVMTVRVDGDRVLSYEPLLEGFLHGEEATGRPVDVLVMPDGALLVSDSSAGAVYRVSYSAVSAPPNS